MIWCSSQIVGFETTANFLLVYSLSFLRNLSFSVCAIVLALLESSSEITCILSYNPV